jgi:uncharacterized protein YbjQ (UPF0145 family)
MTCLLAAGALALLAGVAGAQEPLRGAPLRVFDATELTPDRYVVIRRIWVEHGRSALWLPAHDDASAAIAALAAQAERLGADAVTNLVCVNDARARLDRGYFCYGTAIRLR